jgi:predicted porin
LGEVATVQIHAVPERQSGLGARYDLDGRRVFLSLDAGVFEEKGLSLQAGQNFRSTNYMASIGYHFSPALSVSASEERQRETLSGAGISGTQYEATALDLQWQMQKNFAMKFRAERFKRTDSTLDFAETRYSILAVWKVLGTKDLFARKPIRYSPRPNSQLRY